MEISVLKEVFKIKVIGIAGKTGCGKTCAANYLAGKLKSSIKLDVDLLAKEIYKENDSLAGKVANCFGKEVLNSDGSINYSCLGKKVFSSCTEMKKLNDLTFPLIFDRVSCFIKENSVKDYIIIDAAILFDAGLDYFCDKIILIRADAKERENFLKCKNLNMRIEDIRQRIKNQKIKIKKDEVDFIIENNSSLASFYRNIDVIIDKL